MSDQGEEIKKLVGDKIRKFEYLRGDRLVFESHWNEIADRMLPAQSRSFFTNKQFSKGAKRTELIFDSTAASALSRFAAILDSLLTPRNQTWHRLLPSNPYLAKDRNVKLYFEEANRLLFKHRYAPRANFSSQNQQNYLSLGGFGTGCMFIDSLYGDAGIRYRAVHLGEIYFTENHQGMVDSAYRIFRMTAHQAVKMFGADKLPAPIVSAMEKNQEQEFEFLHCVAPNDAYEHGRLDYRGKLFKSEYISILERHLIAEAGYNTFPYAISRYEQSIGEVYGRSPAMTALPAVKTLNEQKKTMLKQGHRALDPVLITHDDGIIDGFSLRPGAINAGGVTADGRPLVHALPVGNIAAGKEMMDDERAVINDVFLVTLFQILTETPQMTATEVMERAREKGVLLAPTIGRQQSEYLGPMIDREIDLLAQQGILPPMPDILKEAKGEYRLEYDSPLSRSQRAEEASGLMRTIETVLQVVNITQNQEPLDHFNWDVIVPEVSEIQAVPARWMRAGEEVAAIRQGRAQQQQQQTAIQAAPGVAAIANADAKQKAVSR